MQVKSERSLTNSHKSLISLSVFGLEANLFVPVVISKQVPTYSGQCSALIFFLWFLFGCDICLWWLCWDMQAIVCVSKFQHYFLFLCIIYCVKSILVLLLYTCFMYLCYCYDMILAKWCSAVVSRHHPMKHGHPAVFACCYLDQAYLVCLHQVSQWGSIDSLFHMLHFIN